jgi:tight adherence protein B
LALLSGITCAALTACALPAIKRRYLIMLVSAGKVRAGFSGGAGLVERLVARRRISAVRQQLAGALLTMSTSVRAGLSLSQALASAGERIPAPLGGELARVSGELALGGTMESALRGLEARIPIPEMQMLAAGLELARTTGASLAPLLDRLAETLREREQLRGQLRAMTAQGRLSGWVVGLVPAALLALMGLIDPGFVRPLFVTPAGWMMLGTAAVLEGLGALAIRAVMRVEL